MGVYVRIEEANVLYKPSLMGSTTASAAHELKVTPTMMCTDVDWEFSRKHNVVKTVEEWISIDDEDFVKFKNGGKRLPSTKNKVVVDDRDLTGQTVHSRNRPDRERAKVVEGDVGPYNKGTGNLYMYKGRLAEAETEPPADWDTTPPFFYRTDPASPQKMNRDHQNNQAALKERQEDPGRGIAITVPQWVHMNGYTFGYKAQNVYGKSSRWGNAFPERNADLPGQSRTQWIANHATEGLFKEIYHSLRLYHKSDQLSFEIVGSFRYLYKLSVKNNGYAPSDRLDALLMYYLGRAT